MRNFYADALNYEVFDKIKAVATKTGVRAYVIGGFVRDYFLGRENYDVDVVVEGSGIEFARAFADEVGEELRYYENYGTAMVKFNCMEVEFVGARKEMYERGSRNPIVEKGTLEDDQKRRDFTINAMAFSLNENDFGTLIDPFNGLQDLKDGIIRTPLDPDVTFSDDPLRIYRAIRFSVQLSGNGKYFVICDDAWKAIEKNNTRINILTRERITTEVDKMFQYNESYRGLQRILDLGLWELTFGISTMRDERSVVMLHNIEKLTGYRLYGENSTELKWATVVGWNSPSWMIDDFIRFIRLPNKLGDFIKTILPLRKYYHGHEACKRMEFLRRAKYEGKELIIDSLIYWQAWEEVNYPEEVEYIKEKYRIFREVVRELPKIDCPVDGKTICQYMGLEEGKVVGEIKTKIVDAIVKGEIENSIAGAYLWMFYNKEFYQKN